MFFEALKAFIIGVVEGITEWLPISSTGHMVLVDEFIKLDVSAQFLEMFLVVIQIGAILAVILLYFTKLNPFSRKKTRAERKGTWRLWGMVLIGTIPAAIVGFLADDWVHDHFYNAITIAIMLILYGVIFIIMEHRNKKKETQAWIEAKLSHAKHGNWNRGAQASAGRGMRAPSSPSLGKLSSDDAALSEEIAKERAYASIFKTRTVDEIGPATAIKIGLFQILAIIPGTSRSGATIIGGMLCGCSRTAAAEFTFFLAIPVMFGWGIVKAVKFLADGIVMSQTEIVVLAVGIVTAFVVSVLSIKFLMGYIKNNDFAPFGWYRIVIGVVVLAYFGFTGQIFSA